MLWWLCEWLCDVLVIHSSGVHYMLHSGNLGDPGQQNLWNKIPILSSYSTQHTLMRVMRKSNKGKENQSVVRDASWQGDVWEETRSKVNETAIWASWEGVFQVRAGAHLTYWRNREFLKDSRRKQKGSEATVWTLDNSSACQHCSADILSGVHTLSGLYTQEANGSRHCNRKSVHQFFENVCNTDIRIPGKNGRKASSFWKCLKSCSVIS